MNYSDIPLSDNNSNKDSWRQALMASAALWLTICLFGPFLLELAFWPVSDLWAYVISLFLVSAILTALTSLILVKLIPKPIFEFGTVLVVALGFIIYGRVFLLPDLASRLPKTIFNIELSRHYLLFGALLISASLVALWLLRHSLFSHITTVAIAFISFQMAYASIWYLSAPIPQQNYGYRLINDYSNSFSKSRNIIVLVFDSFNSDDFQAILEKHNHFADCLEGFTFYPDSLGGYCPTVGAVPHILTGLFHDNSVPMNEFLRTKLPSESIPGILKKASFRTEAYGAGAQYALQAPVLDNMTNKKRILLEPSEVARVITQFVIRFTPGFARQHLIRSYIKVSRGTPYGALWLGSAYDLAKIEQLEKLAIADTLNSVFKYEHFWSPHTPYILSESAQIRQSASSSEARIVQATAAMKLCCKYLAVLKKIGVYNNSMIFVIADHGASGQEPFPLLMWKPLNNTQPFRVSAKPVAQADIIKTICDELGIPIVRKNAQSLSNEGNTSSRIRRYRPFSGRATKEQPGYLPELREFIVDGPVDSHLSLIPTSQFFPPGGVGKIPRLPIGSTLEFKKSGNYYLYTSVSGWNAPEANMVWNNGPIAGLFLPINNFGSAIKISIQCQPFLSAPHITEQQLKVFAGNDGQHLFEGKLTEPSTITFVAPPEAFAKDVLSLRFQFANDGKSVSLESLTISK